MASTQMPPPHEMWHRTSAPSPAEGPTVVIPSYGHQQPYYQGYPPAPQWIPPMPPPRRNTAAIWAVVAGVVAVAATATAVTIAATAGDEDDQPANTAGGTTTINAPVPTAPSTTEAPTTTAAPAPDPAAVLLSPREVERLIGGSLNSVGGRPSLITNSTTLDQPQCISVWTPADESSYGNSDYDEASFEILEDAAADNRLIVQAAVSFPSARDAQSFFRDTQQSWQDCAGQVIVATTKEGKQLHWQAGDVRSAGTTMSIGQLDPGTATLVCERALDVSGAMVVDTMVCGGRPVGQAVDLASAIAQNAESEGT